MVEFYLYILNSVFLKHVINDFFFFVLRQVYSSGYCGQHPQPYLNHREVYSQIFRQRKKEELTSPRSSISSKSGDSSSFLSPASTPEIKTLRHKREKMVKQASIKWSVCFALQIRLSLFFQTMSGFLMLLCSFSG